MSELSGADLLDALERGEVRAATPRDGGGWDVHAWVKERILDLFRSSEVVGQGLELEGGLTGGAHVFRDKAPLTVRRFAAEHGVRVVPGGSSIRRGAHVGEGVVCMPPMYVNVGAFVGAGSMIDSHALVGSCAQVGSGVHLSAGAQLGGVLEPAGARPVIVEDDAFVGANAAVLEGVLVGARAVVAAGTVLTATTRVYDLARREELAGTPDAPLEIPAGAVVVPGTRPAADEWARERGLALGCAVVAKYRDEGTDARAALESALR